MQFSMGLHRNDITVAQRRKAVARALAGESITKVAEEIGTTFQSLRAWMNKPEFGGDPNWIVPGKRDESTSPLPLEAAPQKRKPTPKPKHEINFCPRCGLNLRG